MKFLEAALSACYYSGPCRPRTQCIVSRAMTSVVLICRPQVTGKAVPASVRNVSEP
jgi:hypothetical protein